jgi:hypothetical protein
MFILQTFKKMKISKSTYWSKGKKIRKYIAETPAALTAGKQIF